MGGPKKPGDKYNYDVAAYLKLNEYQYGIVKLNLTSHHFDAAPNDFPPDASVFDRATSIDLIASTSSFEFLFECKSSDKPTPIHVYSTEFKKALFAFISLEKYRRSQSRTVTFGLITNRSIQELILEIDGLKNSSASLDEYVEKIHAQKVPDWQDINQTITSSQILHAINNLILIFIEKGLLRHFENDKNFRVAREEIVKEVEKKDPFVVPPSIATMTRIELLLDNDDEYTCRKREGSLIRVSTKILKEIERYERRLSQKLTLATSRELPFFSCCTFVRCPQVTTEQAGNLLTEVINDCIEEDLGKALFIAAFLPGQSEIFFAEAKWLSTLADSPDPTSNCLLLHRNGNVIPVPPYVYPLLLRETRRILDRTIITPKFSTSDDVPY